MVLALDGTVLYSNRVALDSSGLTAGEVKNNGFLMRASHPDFSTTRYEMYPARSSAGTATDIDDRKKTEERLRKENLLLREEIDRVFDVR